MTDTVAEEARRLVDLPPAQWPAYVTANSGLPGPRANLRLVTAVAMHADPATVEQLCDALCATDDEFAVMCAAAALARRAHQPGLAARAQTLAADARWRVREGVAIGLQLWGDEDISGLCDLVREWADHRDRLVQRAAVAAICEPRLLRDGPAAAVALDTCARVTRSLASAPASERRSAPARTLRQALGYCWSVAVAADPALGLGVFAALDTTDDDIAWIVRENLRKKRLSALV